jgi:hypothetical protein
MPFIGSFESNPSGARLFKTLKFKLDVATAVAFIIAHLKLL